MFHDGRYLLNLPLLRVAERRGLEGVVSKRQDAPSRSGESAKLDGCLKE